MFFINIAHALSIYCFGSSLFLGHLYFLHKTEIPQFNLRIRMN